MIEETLKAVLEAEAQADEIMQKALEDAKATVAHADTEAEKIRKDIREKVKADRKNVVIQANKDADIKFDEIIKNESIKCVELKKNTQKTEAVDMIKEKILNKYSI